ncbi:MAG: indole-3-glycerol phosphate synthase TrpC [Salinivirgaceae bacterium]|jgi:indole-3-glycerol phosphate synthase|nr:indole-3-glycerol phosphate synthase TrpC [Salinivirgaceae bacterium]
MATILDKIIEHKKVEVENQKKLVSINELLTQKRGRSSYSLKANLLKEGASGIIAEFKRKSPSKGWIDQNAISTEVVPAYEHAGASGSSILTDLEFFGGTSNDLIEAAKLVKLPILRKDFMIDEYQIIEASKIGADVILLIASCLSPLRVKELAQTAQEYKLEVLLEIHNHKELEHICKDVNLVGVNNRNLHTFTTSLETSVDLSGHITDDFVKISESGIASGADIQHLLSHGYKGFLIGESFMKTDNPGRACEKFINSVKYE